MKVFRIQFDGEWDTVEATSMREAIAIWKEHLVKENDETLREEEPEQVVLLDDKPVLR